MGKEKFKISQFVPFLPFGFTSRQALCTSILNDPMAWVEYDPQLAMADRELICSRQWQYANAHIKTLIEQGYIEEVKRKYGKDNWEVFQQLRITEQGYNLLTGSCTEKTEHDRITACVNSGMGYRAAAEYAMKGIIDTHFMLQETKERSGNSHPQFIKMLMRTIARGDATLMAYGDVPASAVDFVSQGSNGHQQYRAWKISNINTMFRANGFLTNLDRRPICIADKQPELNESATNMKSFYDHCNNTLTHWYDSMEESFLFSYPWAKMQDGLTFGNQTLPWEQVPTFYATTEFPGFANSSAASIDTEELTSAANVIRYNLTGVAIGLKHNYLVYHTRPHHTPLNEKREENTCLTAQYNLEILNEEYPIFGAKREIRNAIIFCPSVKQFKTLFTNIGKKMGHKPVMNPTNGVFDTMSIVPINNSGTAQLRKLMVASPIECETELVYRLTEVNPNLRRTNDPLFQLSYESTPVHVAHFMCYDKLYKIWKYYKSGQKFFVMCYPEQVKYLRQLFPDAEFL